MACDGATEFTRLLQFNKRSTRERLGIPCDKIDKSISYVRTCAEREEYLSSEFKEITMSE